MNLNAEILNQQRSSTIARERRWCTDLGVGNPSGAKARVVLA
jgi:hypothetical protein